MSDCRHCGAPLPAGALFCGECGRSVNAPVQERTAPRQRLFPPPRPGDGAEEAPVGEAERAEPRAEEPDERDEHDEQGAPDAAALDVREAVPDEQETPLPAASPTQRVDPVPPAPPIIPVPVTAPAERAEDLERTRISAQSTGEVWVLQFSTGESVLVTGTGLVGRNPAAEPGEYVDHLVTLFDAGRSVSKTHLEFGQDGGRFWVSDRYSTNGSVIRPPGDEPRRCAPGRRYLVSRGTRVDIGEQFFVVS